MRRQTFFLISVLFHLILMLLIPFLKFKFTDNPLTVYPKNQPVTIQLQSLPQKQVTKLISPNIPVIVKKFNMGSSKKGKNGKPLKPVAKPKISKPKTPKPFVSKKKAESQLPVNTDKNIQPSKPKQKTISKPSFNPLKYYGQNQSTYTPPLSIKKSSKQSNPKSNLSSLDFKDANFDNFIPSDKDYGQGDGILATGGSAIFNNHGYDITPWAKRVVYRIKKNWNIPASVNFGLNGIVNIYAVIQKHGNLKYLIVKKSSNIQSFDRAAFSAIKISAPFPQLPADFPYNQIEGIISFRYN